MASEQNLINSMAFIGRIVKKFVTLHLSHLTHITTYHATVSDRYNPRHTVTWSLL